MNLNSLNLAERQLILRVKQVTGLMEKKHEQLQQSGVFGEYKKIYGGYVELIGSENEGLEALKRAAFLMWYEQAEPACFSGVFGLPKESGQRVVKSLERIVEAEGFDSELKWMLPFYNAIADWVFLPYVDLVHLQSFLSKANPEAWLELKLKAEDFRDRGQMGDYWVSVMEAAVERKTYEEG